MSIALIHVQVMLNFCTTLVSSATRAVINRKKESFKCFNFAGAEVPENIISKSAANVHTEHLRDNARDVGLSTVESGDVQ